MAITGALLMGATILAGIPGYTAKAEPITNVIRPNRVIYEGEIMRAPRAVYYVKQGMSENFYENIEFYASYVSEAAIEYLLHEDEYGDVYFMAEPTHLLKDYTVPAPEKGSNGWIITMLVTLDAGTDQASDIYILEPYTAPIENGSSDNAAPADTAPVYTAPIYVEPAWLTTWKGMLAGIDKQIADAKAGDTVILDLGEYYNISNARMQQIAEKNDVTFVLNMTYDKVSYSLTIKPGTEIDLSCDWYGPLKLLSMFPYEVVE